MKGSNKKQVKNKKVHKNKSNKLLKRSHLHSGNNAYNSWMNAHHVQTQPDGQPQGKHDAKNKETCRCGSCSNAGLEKGTISKA